MSSLPQSSWGWDLASWKSDPIDFDIRWADNLLAHGWPPFRVARHFLEEGSCSRGLIDWLIVTGGTASEIGRFLRETEVPMKELLPAMLGLSVEQRRELLDARKEGRPFRPLPSAKAPVAEVAQYLDEAVAGEGWVIVNGIDGPHVVDAVSDRALFERLCELNKWPKPQVFKALIHRRIATKKMGEERLPEGNVDNSQTTLGVTIYPNRFPVPPLLCPISLRMMGIATGLVTDFTKPCGSPNCPNCGPNIADDLVRSLAQVMEGLSSVYLARNFSWSPQLRDRVRQRVHKRGAGLFAYRDVTDNMMMISDRDLGGTEEPREFEKVTPTEAIEITVKHALAVPGQKSASFSGTWTKPTAAAVGDGSQVSLSGLGDDQVQTIKKAHARYAKAELGIDIGADPVPPGSWEQLERRLRWIIDLVRRGRPIPDPIARP